MFTNYCTFLFSPYFIEIIPSEKYYYHLWITKSNRFLVLFHRRTSETRKQALQDICDRARSTDHLLPQLFLCPEGTNTNRKALIQFKIGNVKIREITWQFYSIPGVYISYQLIIAFFPPKYRRLRSRCPSSTCPDQISRYWTSRCHYMDL